MNHIDEIKARLANLHATQEQKNASRDAELAWLGAIDEVSGSAASDIAFLLAEVERLRSEITTEKAATLTYLRECELSWYVGAIERGDHRKKKAKSSSGDGRNELADAIEQGAHRKKP